MVIQHGRAAAAGPGITVVAAVGPRLQLEQTVRLNNFVGELGPVTLVVRKGVGVRTHVGVKHEHALARHPLVETLTNRPEVVPLAGEVLVFQEEVAVVTDEFGGRKRNRHIDAGRQNPRQIDRVDPFGAGRLLEDRHRMHESTRRHNVPRPDGAVDHRSRRTEDVIVVKVREAFPGMEILVRRVGRLEIAERKQAFVLAFDTETDHQVVEPQAPVDLVGLVLGEGVLLVVDVLRVDRVKTGRDREFIPGVRAFRQQHDSRKDPVCDHEVLRTERQLHVRRRVEGQQNTVRTRHTIQRDRIDEIIEVDRAVVEDVHAVLEHTLAVPRIFTVCSVVGRSDGRVEDVVVRTGMARLTQVDKPVQVVIPEPDVFVRIHIRTVARIRMVRAVPFFPHDAVVERRLGTVRQKLHHQHVARVTPVVAMHRGRVWAGRWSHLITATRRRRGHVVVADVVSPDGRHANLAAVSEAIRGRVLVDQCTERRRNLTKPLVSPQVVLRGG